MLLYSAFQTHFLSLLFFSSPLVYPPQRRFCPSSLCDVGNFRQSFFSFLTWCTNSSAHSPFVATGTPTGYTFISWAWFRCFFVLSSNNLHSYPLAPSPNPHSFPHSSFLYLIEIMFAKPGFLVFAIQTALLLCSTEARIRS